MKKEECRMQKKTGLRGCRWQVLDFTSAFIIHNSAF
jgi:hypothetical protein